MPETIRPSGVRITVPATFTVEPDTPPAGRRAARLPGGKLPRGPVPLGQGAAAADDRDMLVQALGQHGLAAVDTINLSPTQAPSPPSGRRAPGAAPIPDQQSATIELDVDPDEHAVVLVEQDGMYSWALPEPAADAPAGGPGKRRRAAPATGKRLAFRVEIRATQAEGPATRMGLLGRIVYGGVKAIVLKYAAKLIVQYGLDYLERDAREALLIVDSLDPAAWRPSASITLPKGRPARVLLLVHGTFSTTIGSFGALTATPWGRAFIAAARANYDVALGFDHYTLKRDPAENALTLARELGRIAWPEGSQIDVVAFSRGGLVMRSLMDELSPKLPSALRFRRAIFVACANEGTRLADPENIRAFIDLYTNLAVAACHLIGMLPQATAVAVILKELITGIASLVKYIAASAIGDAAIPGLAAMLPGGAFIEDLDRSRETKSRLADVTNYVVTSEFAPNIRDSEPKELPARFLALIAGGFVTQLMQEANDLVVNTASMATIEPKHEQLVHDRFDFGQTSKVYHTTYFLRPEVVAALTKWLDLVDPAELAATPVRAGAPATRATRTLKKRQPVRTIPVRMRKPGAAHRPAHSLSAHVDTRFVVASARSPVGHVIGGLGTSPDPYVVVKRFHRGEALHYSIPTDDIIALGKHDPETPLEVALQLHESDAAQVRGPRESGPARRGPAVVLEGGRVLGVVPAESGSSTDIVELAKAALDSTTPSAAAKGKRAMPTFAPSKPAETTTTLHMRAEIDDPVVVAHATSVDVVLSREMIEGATGAGAGKGSAKVQVASKVVVQAIPRAQFEVIGTSRYEIDVPPPGKPWTGTFDVRPTHVGDGEIWIVMSQNQAVLTTVALHPKIVEKSERRGRAVGQGSAAEQAPRPAIDQLFIVEQRNGNEITLWLYFQAPISGIVDEYRTPPFKTDPLDYVKKLYKQIEDQYVGSKDDADDFTQKLRERGAALFAELFPPDLQAKLWKLRDRLTKIQILSTEPLIPWELVHLKEPGKPLGDKMRFFAQMGIVRWLHRAGAPPTGLVVRPGRVRHVIPAYPDPTYALKDVESERKFFETELKSTAIEPHIGAVRSALKDPEAFDLLHFACHGKAESDNIAEAGIMLEGRVEGTNYIPEYLDATTVEYNANLHNPDGNRPLVFLNACQVGRTGYALTGFGGFAQAFLSAGAGVFAGTLWSVGDQPASTFAKTFYQRLQAGDDLSTAATKAREKSRKAGDASWLCYVVYGDPSAKVVMET